MKFHTSPADTRCRPIHKIHHDVGAENILPLHRVFHSIPVPSGVITDVHSLPNTRLPRESIADVSLVCIDGRLYRVVQRLIKITTFEFVVTI